MCRCGEVGVSVGKWVWVWRGDVSVGVGKWWVWGVKCGCDVGGCGRYSSGQKITLRFLKRCSRCTV